MSQTDGRSRSRPTLRLLKRVLATAAVLLLLAWVVWRAWGDVSAVHWRGLALRPELLGLAVVLPLLAFAVQAVTWVVMMRGLGYGLGWWAGLRAHLLSLLGNYVPGKVLIVVIRAGAVQRHGLPGLPVAGSVVLETLLRTVVGALLAAAGLYWMGLGQGYAAGLLALLLLFGALGHPRVFHALGDWLLVRLGRDPIPRRLAARDIALMMLGYLGFWLLYGAGFCLLAWGVLGAQARGTAALGVSFVVSQISSNLAVFAPVGLGVSDATLAEVLRVTGAVMAGGLLALVARAWRTVCELLGAGLGYLLPDRPPAD